MRAALSAPARMLRCKLGVRSCCAKSSAIRSRCGMRPVKHRQQKLARTNHLTVCSGWMTVSCRGKRRILSKGSYTVQLADSVGAVIARHAGRVISLHEAMTDCSAAKTADHPDVSCRLLRCRSRRAPGCANNGGLATGDRVRDGHVGSVAVRRGAVSSIR